MKAPGPVIKLSAPGTGQFWPVPVVYEDSRLLAIDKPARLLTSPDRYDPDRPNLMKLLHAGVERGAEWAASRKLDYLANAHRLDFETTGVLLLAKDKPALIHLANQFGGAKPEKTYVALVPGNPEQDEFEVDLKLMQDPRLTGMMRWSKDGKKAVTRFRVLERFRGVTLLSCHPETGRTHQIRVHLKFAGFPIYGDEFYGEGRRLFLSALKPSYRLKEGQEERPLTPSLALHAWKLGVAHPDDERRVEITAPWHDDLEVALKYLRKFCK
jgi:RluA family pseudouridine synthase